jgi:ASCH domain
VLPEDLPVAEFAFPGPLRDRLVGAILDGAKTTTTALAAEYTIKGESLPRPGWREAVADSAGNLVAVIETTAVQVIRLGDVDLAHAVCEGEGFTSVAEWAFRLVVTAAGRGGRDGLLVPGYTIPVLNIIGPVGIGKSTVADAISEIFQYDHALPHAVIDLDDVRPCYPAPDDEFQITLGFANLAAVWGNCAAAGARCLIIPSLMGGGDDMAAIRLAVPGAEVFVVRLTAPLEVIQERIRGREITEASLNWHLQRAADLVNTMPVERREDAVVSTEGRRAAEIAREVVAKWGILEDA